MLTELEIKQLAAERKIDEYSLLREYLQLLFLKSFYERAGSQTTFFKGGTAIRFLFGSFRFSEDLDFTTAINKARMEKMITTVLAEIKRETGLEVSFKSAPSLATNFTFRLQFENLPLSSPRLFLKLDFSTRENVLEPQASVLETTLPVSPLPVAKHLSPKEILAEKIRAILHRVRGRDLFDLWYLLSKKTPLDWRFIDRKLSYYHETTNRQDLLHRLEAFSDKLIRFDLDKYLPENFRRAGLQLVPKIKEALEEKVGP